MGDERPVPANIVRSVAEAGAWWRTKAQTLEQERDALTAQLAEARRALAFYADEASHTTRRTVVAYSGVVGSGEQVAYVSAYSQDAGQRARAALDALVPGSGGGGG